MTTNKSRARAQQGPRAARKTTGTVTPTAHDSARSAFHQSSSRDYVKKMTIEVDRDLHAELKTIAAREGLTIREIVGSCLEQYVTDNR